VSVTVALLLSVVVYIQMRDDVGAVVLDRVEQGAAHFGIFADDLLDGREPPDAALLQARLEAFTARPRRNPLGRFVAIRLLAPDGRPLARVSDAGYAGIREAEDLLDRSGGRLNGGAKYGRAVTQVSGKPCVHVVLPLENSRGEKTLDVAALFAVSDRVLWKIRLRMVRAVGLGLLIILATAALMYPTILGLLRRQAALSASLLDSHLETLQVLGNAIAKRDSDTDAHNYRVTVISVRLAEAAGLSHPEIQGLIKGAFLHDIGKIGVRDEVLLKPGRLTDEEFALMRQHVPHGIEIVERSGWLADALKVVGYHHEKMSGSGYPNGVSGKGIPVTARVFAIADVFDALTSRRPYKEPLSFEDAMAILEEGRGNHFDPELLDFFAGIARDLYDELAGREERPRAIVADLLDRYFRDLDRVAVSSSGGREE